MMLLKYQSATNSLVCNTCTNHIPDVKWKSYTKYANSRSGFQHITLRCFIFSSSQTVVYSNTTCGRGSHWRGSCSVPSMLCARRRRRRRQISLYFSIYTYLLCQHKQDQYVTYSNHTSSSALGERIHMLQKEYFLQSSLQRFLLSHATTFPCILLVYSINLFKTFHLGPFQCHGRQCFQHTL